MKKIQFSILLFWGMISVAFSQTATVETPVSSSNSLMPFYIVLGFIFIVAILVLVVAIYLLQILDVMVRQAERERAEKLGTKYKESPTFWQKIWNRWNDFRPIEEESDVLLDHNYDGIKELDNHLPPWWKWLFYVTIMFAAVYLVGHHIFNFMPTQLQEYDGEVAYAKAQVEKIKASSPVAAIDETNVVITNDATALAEGQQTFMNTCSSCHRKDGGGDIGPNLTDEYWVHGGGIKDIFKVIRYGVKGTNMISWEGVISPVKMQNVASYILSIQGSNPSNPKKPEGDIYKSVEAKTDSVVAK